MRLRPRARRPASCPARSRRSSGRCRRPPACPCRRWTDTPARTCRSSRIAPLAVLNSGCSRFLTVRPSCASAPVAMTPTSASNLVVEDRPRPAGPTRRSRGPPSAWSRPPGAPRGTAPASRRHDALRASFGRSGHGVGDSGAGNRRGRAAASRARRARPEPPVEAVRRRSTRLKKDPVAKPAGFQKAADPSSATAVKAPPMPGRADADGGLGLGKRRSRASPSGESGPNCSDGRRLAWVQLTRSFP